MSFVEQFDQLFGGRRDNWALGSPKLNDPYRYEYFRKEAPLTLSLLDKHLRGELLIGVYPIVNGNVNWFSVDIDGPKDKETKIPLPDAYEKALEIAVKQLAAFDAAGLETYIERSRGGNGIHVWGFLHDWLPAAVVRRAIEPLLVIPPKVGPLDRLYPVQNDVEGLGEKLGNLLALPFWGQGIKEGKSVFIDPITFMPIPPREFMATVYKNQSAIIYNLEAENAEPTRQISNAKAFVKVGAALTRDELFTGALKTISPYGCKFMRHCWTNRREGGEEEWYTMLGQATYFENGREFAHLMSRDYPKYNERETNSKFDHAAQNPARGCAYIKDKFPHLVCDNCEMTAPYRSGSKPLVELVMDTEGTMELMGDFQDDLKLIKDLNNGVVVGGYSWGIPTVDKMTRLRPNELTVFGGLPNIGKTWALVDSSYSMAEQGTRALVFSGETSRQPLRMRMLARASGIELQRIRGETPFKLTNPEYSKLEVSGEYLKSLPIHHNFTTLTPEKVYLATERALISNSIALDSSYTVIFDYLQFALREAGEETHEHVNRLSWEFKALAKVLEHPVLVFSQLTRQAEGKEEPTMSDFANSAGIERNADVLIVMTGPRVSGLYSNRIWHNVKQREGEAQTKLNFLLHQGCGFFEPPRTEVEAPRESLTEDFN